MERRSAGKLFLVTMLMFWQAVVSARGAQPLPGVTILISDVAAVPASVLLAAERQAAHIFHRAGLEVEWRECSVSSMKAGTWKGCEQDKSRPAFWLHIVKRKFPGVSTEALGFSMLDGGSVHAYVVYPDVE